MPLSKMPKDVLDKFCRQMLNFCVPKKQTRGRGSLAVWEERFPVSSLSSRTRALLKGDTVALSDVRSWNPGMALGAKFKQGPGPGDKEWRMSMPWMKFLVLVTEVLCLKCGCDPEAGQDLFHEKRCCMLTSLCRVKFLDAVTIGVLDYFCLGLELTAVTLLTAWGNRSTKGKWLDIFLNVFDKWMFDCYPTMAWNGLLL